MSKSQEIVFEKFTETFTRASVEVSSSNSTQTSAKNGSVSADSHPAYQLYKDAGEYWNKCPKTDYTYSKHSPHRRELGNGFVAMPNMSRKSIHREEEDTPTIGGSKVGVRRRLTNFFRRVSITGVQDIKHFQQSQRTETLYTRIVLFFSTFVQRILWWREEVAAANWKHRQREKEERFVWLKSSISTITSGFYRFLSYFSYIYLLVAYETVLSAKLLQTATPRPSGYRFFGCLLLLLLVPLLIFLGLWFWPKAALIVPSESGIVTSETPIVTSQSPIVISPIVATQSPVIITTPPVLLSTDVSDDITKLSNKINELLIKMNRLEEFNQVIKKEVLMEVKTKLNSQENLIKNENLMSLKLIEDRFNNLNTNFNCENCFDLVREEVKMAVAGILRKYDADKTGMTDYALETAGGQIVSTRCTEHFYLHTKQLTVFGIPIYNINNNSPRIAITPGLNPGECWAFQGFPGYLLIKLSHAIRVTGVTMEHIPKDIAPKQQIDSAPKQFSVWSMTSERDENPQQLGKFVFEDNGESLQFFGIGGEDVTQFVELRIESNHGNWRYTCLYRFRVHGVIPP